MITIGNDNFSIKCNKGKSFVENGTEWELGEFYLHVNGDTYGDNETSLKASIENVIFCLSQNNYFLPELYDFSAEELFLSRDAAHSDEANRSQCKIDYVFPGYFDDCLESGIDDIIVFYGGQYAFDKMEIIMVSNGDKTKLSIRDCNGERVNQVTLDKNQFLNMLIELKTKLYDLKPIK